ncbi:MAG: hypothetical protein ACE15C_21290 [Phycisphaerae bacterium]
MAKRWIHSLDVEVSPSGSPLFDIAGCTAFAGGTKTVPQASTPQPLVATSVPCRFVWVGARVDGSGNPQNSVPCFIGDSANQNIPVMPSNYEGLVIRIDDASKVYVKVGVNGQGVVYRVFA